ncbi:hypothetical protein [Nocardia sp. BMG111209]|uniref:hypothetical protein n=1 Tax=Nocardia sp. BMG111209 TaxID=1160137 RepID=UPI0003620443|nr:hypothetical protein [Nocardia sp. BMG111209]
MKYFHAPETGTLYRLDGPALIGIDPDEHGVYTIDEDFEFEVDEDLVGSEKIRDDAPRTLGDLYAEVRAALSSPTAVERN